MSLAVLAECRCQLSGTQVRKKDVYSTDKTYHSADAALCSIARHLANLQCHCMIIKGMKMYEGFFN